MTSYSRSVAVTTTIIITVVSATGDSDCYVDHSYFNTNYLVVTEIVRPAIDRFS